MPGIWPRVRELLFGGFGLVAYQIALIFQMVRILPPQHPYFVPSNITKFGILDVFREASRHLKFSRSHIDQVIIYFCLLGGLLIICFFFLSMIVILVSTPAFAGVNYSIINNVFLTPNPTEDVAFRLLDRVFGIPGIYNSGDLSPTAFHTAFHGLLRYYSTLMIFIAVIVIFYYTAVVVGETSLYGTPFGRRFDTVWAPLRLVMAIGLLIPLSNGLNSGQYITLYAAKFGSSFGTNLWLKYNDSIKGSLGASDATPLGYKPEDLIITPQPQGIPNILEFLHTAGTCNILYRRELGYNTGVFLVDEKSATTITTTNPSQELSDFIQNKDANGVRQAPRKTDPRFIFGDQDIAKYGKKYQHGIRPLCGEIAVPFNATSNLVVVKLQAGILGLIVGLATTTSFGSYADNMISNNYPGTNRTPKPALNAGYANTLVTELEAFFAGALPSIVAAYGANNPLDIVKSIRDLGWAGSGVWYNRLAEVNGPIISAQFNIAYPISYPMVMEEVSSQVSKANPSVIGVNRYNPQAGGDKPITINKEGLSDPNLGIARTLNASYTYWYNSGAVENNEPQGNIFLDFMSSLFGLQALYDMRENGHLHPMVSLIGLGKSMIEKGIRHMMIATGAAAAGGLVSILADKRYGRIIDAFAGMFVSFALVGLTAGVVLFYIIPFMPFMFVFFAAGTWVKSIFEAMVGVPLWALAHLRIDGPGLPAQGARQGYLLIFDIFLRPALIVFGLISSLLIFSALVFVLNDIFDLVTTNLTGFQDTKKTGAGVIEWTSVESIRGPIDQFFFTIIYVVLVYLIAISSFKLIDFFPKTIYRWFGGSLQSFAVLAKDEFNEQELIKYSTLGVGAGTQRIGGILTGVGKGFGGAVGQGLNALSGGSLSKTGSAGSAALGLLGIAGTAGGIYAATKPGGPLSGYGPGETSGRDSIEAVFNRAPLSDILERMAPNVQGTALSDKANKIEEAIKSGNASQDQIEELLAEASQLLSPEAVSRLAGHIQQLQQRYRK